MKPIFVLIVFLVTYLLSGAQSFTCGISTVNDIDGNVYQTVLIGSQCWMKENMRATRYANGMPVSAHEIASSNFRETINMPGKLQVQVFLPGWQIISVSIYNITGQEIYHAGLNRGSGNNLLDFSVGPAGMYVVLINGSSFKVMGVDGKRCEARCIAESIAAGLKTDSIVISDTSRNYFNYDNNPALGLQYGTLYTARSALNVNDPPYPQIIKGICPDGWHVPNDWEWIQLEETAGMTHNQAVAMYEFRGSISNKLKIEGPEWYYSEGTDDFGFSAKGSGTYRCDQQGCDFGFLTQQCKLWTYRPENLVYRQIETAQPGIWRSYFSGAGALSVRCVRD